MRTEQKVEDRARAKLREAEAGLERAKAHDEERKKRLAAAGRTPADLARRRRRNRLTAASLVVVSLGTAGVVALHGDFASLGVKEGHVTARQTQITRVRETSDTAIHAYEDAAATGKPAWTAEPGLVVDPAGKTACAQADGYHAVLTMNGVKTGGDPNVLTGGCVLRDGSYQVGTGALDPVAVTLEDLSGDRTKDGLGIAALVLVSLCFCGGSVAWTLSRTVAVPESEEVERARRELEKAKEYLKRRDELAKLVGDDPAFRGGPNPGAGKPALSRKSLEVMVAAAGRRLDELHASVSEYETSTMDLFEHPAAADVNVPTTAAYLAALGRAEHARDLAAATRRPEEAVVVRYDDAVTEATTAWRTAYSYAVHIGHGLLPGPEADRLRQAIFFLKMALDPAYSEDARRNHREKAVKLVEGIVTVSERSLAALEGRTQVQLTGGGPPAGPDTRTGGARKT